MLKKSFPKIFIIILAIVLRFWDISGNPPGVYVDEAVQGYNAFSLLQTGRDQYGKAFPVMTKLFATYSASLYTYYSVLPVKLFGLNAFSTRFTSAIFGVLLCVVTLVYFGSIPGLVLSIAPVFVFFSRASFEANLGLFLLIFSYILLQKHKYFGAFLILSLSSYAYHAERILFLPVFILYLIKVRQTKYLLFLILFLPLIYLMLFTQINSRFSELSTGSMEMFKNIFIYLSPNNLFSRPDPDLQRSFPELSVFYWWMVIPLITGFIKIRNKLKILILMLLLFLPGVITKDYFSTIRVLPAFFILSLIISKGLSINNKKIFLFSVICFLLSIFELYSNLILLKHERSLVWGYPYQQLFAQSFKGQKVLIDSSRQKPLYILYAFYQKVDPTKLQKILYINNYYQNTEFDPYFNFNNIYIKTIDWKSDLTSFNYFIGDNLAISDSQAKEHHLKLVQNIPDINRQAALQVFIHE